MNNCIKKYLLLFCLLVTNFLFARQISIAQQLIKRPESNFPTGRVEKPSSAELEQGIELATRYLESSSGPDGKFVYRVNTAIGLESNSYNIIRHAGTMYALGMLYDSHPDPAIAGILVRSAGFLSQNYIGPGDHPGQLVVWSKPNTLHSYADLGATGLGLVAISEVNRIKPKTIPLEDLEELGRFALSLQKPDGSFYSKYRPESGPVLDWESLYYPGEAALGFIALYEQDHSSEWLIAASKALSYLAKSRAGLPTVPADHWALIATAKLLPYCKHAACQISEEELVQHAIQICNSILAEQMNLPGQGLDGSFDPTGRTTPTATRMEGLLAALEFLPKDNTELRAKIQAAATRGVAFLLRAQIRTGPYAGGMPGAYVANARGASDIRIDYVQHSLSAWLRYERFIEANEMQQKQ